VSQEVIDLHNVSLHHVLTGRTEVASKGQIKMDTVNNQKLLRAKDIQATFGISRNTVTAWIRSKKLRAVRIGGLLFFRTEDIDRLLDSAASDKAGV
jgi:excisionase family DNA binding protein